MRLCGKLILCVTSLLLVAGCSEDDKSGGGANPFGTGGSGANGSGGTGGSGATGGNAGDSGSGGGGTGGTQSGGSGGSEDAGNDAEPDAQQDAPPDIPTVELEPCATAPLAFETTSWVATSPTSVDFMNAWNDEMQNAAAPGPALLRFNGVDSTDSAGWSLDIGAAASGGPPFAFDGSPAAVPFVFEPGKIVIINEKNTSFSLRVGQATLPITRIVLGGSFDDGCAQFASEEIELAVDPSAASIPFGGSTVGDLMGPFDCCDGSDDRWRLVLTGVSQSVQM